MMMLDVYENRRRRGLKQDKVVRVTLLLCDIVRRRRRCCRAMPRVWLGGLIAVDWRSSVCKLS